MYGHDEVRIINFPKFVLNCFVPFFSECQNIVKRRKKWSSERVKECFGHATFLSVAIYNLLISMMPPRVLKLLQFIGFDGNRRKALKYMEAVAFGKSIWADFGALTLLGVHLQLEVVAGLGMYDEELCGRVLSVFKDKLNDVSSACAKLKITIVRFSERVLFNFRRNIRANSRTP